MDLRVWLNGRLVPAAAASVSVFDTGLLHGASLFTTMYCHNGRVFRLDRHVARLLGMASRLSFRLTAPAEDLARAAEAVVAANGLREGRMRITLTAGPVGPEPAPTTIVTGEPLSPYPPGWYEQGIAVIVNPVRQYTGDALAGLKTGCYLPRILARQAAAAQGADEALWFTETGHLAEACFCNVFLVRGGAVVTPPLNTPILAGVVRDAVIELCGSMGIACRDDGPLDYAATMTAQEAFVSSSTMGIRPVVRIGGQAVGDGRPGAVTRRVQQAYQQLLDRECPP